jgi:hypothetical protein
MLRPGNTTLVSLLARSASSATVHGNERDTGTLVSPEALDLNEVLTRIFRELR